MRSLLVAAALAAIFSPGVSAQLSPSRGFQNHALPLAPGAFAGGLDALPNGNLALFDGTSVVEMDPSSGAVVRVLFTPPGFVYGSFVEVDPAGAFLLFGESSNQNVWQVPLDGSTPQASASILFNYDCVFAAPGLAYVSHADAFWTSTEIVLLDVAGQTTDLIAVVAGASGPLALDAAGRLCYGASDAPGLGRVICWTPEQLASAVGPSHLTEADAQVRASGLGNVYGLVIDNQGDLLVADAVAGTLQAYDAYGQLRESVASAASPGGVTCLAVLDPGQGGAVFGAFQPEQGGAIAAVYSDWVSQTEVNVVRPARLALSSTPASPIPAGPFSLDLDQGPPSGVAFLFAAALPYSPEYAVWADDVPFFCALDPASLLVAGPLYLDSAGSLNLPAVNPGWSGTVQVQAALFAANFRPLGTTVPLALTFQ
ncbi:MAG: hypothetical protein HY812_15305 [Planctomycetes bacterium]|nr:hypothetical protein [Planctomycetota bacterium]